jgi:hypothetical protein
MNSQIEEFLTVTVFLMASNLSETNKIFFKGLNSCTVNSHILVVAVKLEVYEIFCPYAWHLMTHALKMPGKTAGVSNPFQKEGEN